MTFTTFPLLPDSRSALALSATHEGAVTALTMFADAAAQEPVGPGSEEFRRGAEWMRAHLAAAARQVAAEFRSAPRDGGGRRSKRGRRQ